MPVELQERTGAMNLSDESWSEAHIVGLAEVLAKPFVRQLGLRGVSPVTSEIFKSQDDE